MGRRDASRCTRNLTSKSHPTAIAPASARAGTDWSRARRLRTTPTLIAYWDLRRRKVLPPLDSYNLCLPAKQDARCRLCGDRILLPDRPPQSSHAWDAWWLGIIKRTIAADYLTHHGRGGTPDGNRTRLIHTSCHRSLRARRHRRPEPTTP